MQCSVLLCALVILRVEAAPLSYTDNQTQPEVIDSAEASETQRATCQIVTDKLVATASATVSRALKGVCSTKEIEKHFQTIRNELNNQINKIHSVLLKTNQQVETLLKIVDQNQQRNTTNEDLKTRDLEIKGKNCTIYEDNVTKKRVFSYYWKIEGVQNRITTNSKQIALLSPKFYINGGYRMYIKLFPHHDKGNIYVHVGLTHGEHDDKLDWPFTLKHRVVIVDQSLATAADITSQVWDPAALCSSSDWQRPALAKDNEECVSFGFTQDTLFSNSYIHKDSLIIKLDVFI